jgi:hypothetical protein
VEKAISVVLTLLLISGCVAPPRQLSKSDAVAEVADSVQPEPLQEAPADICPERQECPVLQSKTNWWAIAGWSFALLVTVYAVFATYRGYETQRKYESVMQPTQTGHLNRQQIERQVRELQAELSRYQQKERELLELVANPETVSQSEWARKFCTAKEEIKNLKTINDRLTDALARAQTRMGHLEVELASLRQQLAQ